MQTIRITTAQNIDIDHEVGGIGERFVAGLIDVGIYIVVLFSVTFVTGMVRGSLMSSTASLIVIGVFFVFYDLICELFLQGQSIGKMVMKIKVISLNGNRPTLQQYVIRWLFRMIDCLPTGYLCGVITIVVSEKSQRLGDMAAGTVLIRTQPRTKIEHVAFMPVEEGYEVVFPQAGRLTDDEAALINEVIRNYAKTRNSMVVYRMATKLRDYLDIQKPEEMNDLKFLQVLAKDYSAQAAQTETTLL